MKKLYRKIRWQIRNGSIRLYLNLSDKLRVLLPEDLDPGVTIVPAKDGTDVVIISLRIPHHLTRKLMWSFKAWKEN